MRKTLLTLLGCWCCLVAWSQDLELLYEVPLEADYLAVDNFGTAYVVNDDELKTFSPEGEPLLVYSDKLLGSITALDVSNRLKILLFYRDLSQIVFLDSKLSEWGPTISLDQIQHEQSTLACSSYNNGLWVYDQVTVELLRIDQNLTVSHNTGSLSQLLRMRLSPNYLVESNDWVYLNDPKEGILVFDIYGTYYKTIPITGLDYFQITGGKIYYPAEGGIMTFDLLSLEKKEVPMLPQSFLWFDVFKDRLFLLHDSGLSVYRFKP